MVRREDGSEEIFSENLACRRCGFSLPEISPRIFSFNSPYGACPECSGLGTRREIAPELVIPDDDRTVGEGGGRPLGGAPRIVAPQRHRGAREALRFLAGRPAPEAEREDPRRSPPRGRLGRWSRARASSAVHPSNTAWRESLTRPCWSTAITITMISSPTRATSSTSRTWWSANCEICTRPSCPGRNSTKAPKGTVRTTLPV